MCVTSGAESRLCAECGMCCNGVLFHSIRLQDADSPRRLAKLGLRIKTRDGEAHAMQPCRAHLGDACGIYRDRPVRCRQFQCRQLLALAAGLTTEMEAMKHILAARELVARVNDLLAQLGEDRLHRAMATRVAATFTPPLAPGEDAESLREALRHVMESLESLLAAEFYPDLPSGNGG